MHPLQNLKAVIFWLSRAWSEQDGNGGKASFSRIAGTYVIIQIVLMSWVTVTVKDAPQVPEAMMTLFWVLIGYQLVSKILNSLSPAVLDIAKSFLIKAGVPIKTDGAKPSL